MIPTSVLVKLHSAPCTLANTVCVPAVTLVKVGLDWNGPSSRANSRFVLPKSSMTVTSMV